MKHKHHIIPRYEGGGDDPSNLVELTPIQHAMWHFAEWQRKGNEQDYVAWKGLSGGMDKQKIRHLLAALGGAIALNNKLGYHARTPEEMGEHGKMGWEKHKQQGTNRADPSFQSNMGKLRRGSPNAKNSCKKINSERFRCLVTGYESTSGPLTCYQKAKGIDPTLREKV